MSREAVLTDWELAGAGPVPASRPRRPRRDRMGPMLAGSVLLHLVLIAALILQQSRQPPAEPAPFSGVTMVFAPAPSKEPARAGAAPQATQPSPEPAAPEPSAPPVLSSPQAQEAVPVPAPEAVPTPVPFVAPTPSPQASAAPAPPPAVVPPTATAPAPAPQATPVPAPEAAPVPVPQQVPQAVQPQPSPPPSSIHVNPFTAPLLALPQPVPIPQAPPMPTAPSPPRAQPAPGFRSPMPYSFGTPRRGPLDLSIGSLGEGLRGMQQSTSVSSADVGEGWLNQLDAWLHRHGYYPEAAAENGEDGTVEVKFVVLQDGTVKGVQLIRGTHSPFLNLAPAAWLRNAHLPPLPPGTKDGEATIDLTVRFILIR